MVVKPHLYGKDASGNSIEHIFEFDSSWVDPGPVPKETLTPQALQFTPQVFSSLDQIIIDEKTDAGPNAAIMMWAALNPYDTYDKLKDACHVAQIMWDGFRMAQIRDKRIISTTVREQLLRPVGNETLKYIATVMAGGNSTVIMEDFRAPRYHDMVPNPERGTTLPNILPANNISKLRVGAEGYYQTRAIAANATSGTYWRVILVPIKETRSEIYYVYQNPPLFQYFNPFTGWGAAAMTAVAGIPNTFDITLPFIPPMIRVAVDCVDYLGMVVFG